MEITVHRVVSEKEEEREGKQRSQSPSFQNDQEKPQTEKEGENDRPKRPQRKIELAAEDPDRIGDQDGNQRQAKYLCHLRPIGSVF